MTEHADVARVAMEIAVDPRKAYTLTGKSARVALVSDASAVLGLGEIGPLAALAVLEERAARFNELADIEAVPLALDAGDEDQLVDTIARIAPAFGAIALCDMAAPRCFEIQAALRARLAIPVLLCDRAGSAVVMLAALINGAAKIGKELRDVHVVVADFGAGGSAAIALLLAAGVADVVVADRRGAITRRERYDGTYVRWVAEHTNGENRAGTLAELMPQADAFISIAPALVVLGPGEGVPDFEEPAGAVVASWRPDRPNYLDELLAYPGIFRGALDARAARITARMQLAAAEAIASSTDAVLPELHRRVVAEVAGRVKFESEAFEAKE
jgi:malate dehydrogenase (oxaloacetate-decarboxylating)